jgi:hypothetical protein
MIKPFSGHENRSSAKPQKPLQGGYPKEPEFLSMRCIKLAQKTPEAEMG